MSTTGRRRILINGVIRAEQTSANSILPFAMRSIATLARSPWPDQFFNGWIHGFHVYNRELTEVEAREDKCAGRQADDECAPGLLARYAIVGDALVDISYNEWNTPAMNNMYTLNRVAQPRLAGGRGVVRFDGNDDVIVLPQRAIGGELTFCVWLKRYSAPNWARWFGFGDGQNNYLLHFAQSGTTEDLQFASSATNAQLALNIPGGLYGGALLAWLLLRSSSV